jgi:hypothetical protein
VYLPKCTKIGKLAFNGCTNLKYIVLPAVTTISANAFNGCTSLEEVVLLSSKKVTLEANALPT